MKPLYKIRIKNTPEEAEEYVNLEAETNPGTILLSVIPTLAGGYMITTYILIEEQDPEPQPLE